MKNEYSKTFQSNKQVTHFKKLAHLFLKRIFAASKKY
tara:strand:- start:96972 stop:97082 length:111 start_codon:yes stop_codon:yes gene_type:complete